MQMYAIIKEVKERKPVAEAVDQRHLYTKATSFADIPAKVENDWRVTVRKLDQAHSMLIERFTTLFTRI